jgi:hypothetical protein
MAQGSPTLSREREAARRLNARTLTIASVASAAAALLVSQLWIAGTWIAAAMTPVIVALVSEGLQRPTDRIARAMTADRTAVYAPPDEYQPRPEREGGRFPRMPDPAPVRVYGRSSRRRRKLAFGAAAITAVVAFVIAFGGITVAEVIGGRSITKGDRQTTFLGGHTSKKKSATEKRDSTQQQEPTRTQPQSTTPQSVPPPTDEPAPQTTTPSETPAPQDTTVPQTPPPTSTTPVQP